MVVKKQWYDIVAPKDFGGAVICQTLAADPKHLVNRVIEISYADIAENFSKFFIKLRFRVVSVEGRECKTDIVGHVIQNDFVYRMVRRYTKKVSLIQDLDTKDKKRVRVKTILILPGYIKTSMKGLIRAKAKEMIEKKGTTTDYHELLKQMILGSFVMTVKKQCSKIYPVSQVEFYKSELLGEAIGNKKTEVEVREVIEEKPVEKLKKRPKKVEEIEDKIEEVK